MPDMRILFPGGKNKALTLSYDDATEQDIRLVSIMDRHGLKGTFNISSELYEPEGTVFPEGQIYRRMTKSQVTDLLLNSNHEVAVHAAQHADLIDQSPAERTWEVIKDRNNLEKQFGCIVRGMAYPYGRYNDDVISMLKSCGIAYSRTVNNNHAFDLPVNWLEWHPTCHHNDPDLMKLARRFAEVEPWFRSEVFYLWGHSYEFDTDNNWNVIEEFASYIGGRENIWYATNIEIYDYVEAWRSKIASADGKRIYNPTVTKLWIRCNNKVHVLEPGQETCIG